jgi:alkylation response protein AidB-like acyl-CoA dehydrogenase
MDFNFTEEQEMLRTSARDFLETECTERVVREAEDGKLGYSADVWKKMTDLGWQGLIFPEQYGGAGMNYIDLAVLYEEMGRAILPSPHLSSVVLSGLTIMEAGSDAQKSEWLPKIAGGAVVALALTEPESSWEGNAWDADGVAVSAKADGDGFVIDGTKLFVHDANIADALLVAARTRTDGKAEDGVSLFLVDAKASGVAVTRLQTIAGDNQCEVVLNNVKVDKASLVGSLNAGWAPLWKSMQIGAVMISAQILGAGQRLLEIAVDYAKTRIQFDMPIGINQYIQEHCVMLLRDVNGCRWSTYLAAWKLTHGEPADFEVAVAKGWSSAAMESAAWRCHQVLAGVGYTIEDGVVPLFSRKGKTLQLYLGDTPFWKEKIVTELEGWPGPEVSRGKPLGIWDEMPDTYIPAWWADFDAKIGAGS